MATDDLERGVFQQPTLKMYEQPPFENWVIFALESDRTLVSKFADCLRDTITTFNYFVKEPKVVLIKSRSYAEWDEVIR